MTTNTNTRTAAPTHVPSPSIPTIRAGQIWRDGHKYRNNCLMLVLDTSGHKVVCQSLNTGKISFTRREQFGRGSQGFYYAADLHDACTKFNTYIKHKTCKQITCQNQITK